MSESIVIREESVSEELSSPPVELPARVNRRWSKNLTRRSTRKRPGSHQDHSSRFRVLSFNVLAQYLCLEGSYPRQDKRWLDPALRFPSLREEISRYSADIIALQEVDEPDWILPYISHPLNPKVQYESKYLRRTGRPFRRLT